MDKRMYISPETDVFKLETKEQLLDGSTPGIKDGSADDSDMGSNMDKFIDIWGNEY